MVDRPRSVLGFACLAVPLVWIGMVFGVSFLATPAKFQVKELELPVAVGISYATFNWLHITEVVLALVLAALLLLAGARWTWWLLVLLAALALGAETGWILPAFQGSPGVVPVLPPLSTMTLHMAFGTAEMVKCIALLALAFGVFRSYGV